MKHFYNVVILLFLSVAAYGQCVGPLSVSIDGSGTGDALEVDGTATQPDCNTESGGLTGAINVTVTGGTLPYTFAWTASAGGPVPNGQEANEDLTNLGTGTYDLLITDAEGCTAEISFSILEPTPVAIDISGVDPSCNEDSGALNGTITIVPSGGTPTGGSVVATEGYQFNWATVDGDVAALVTTAQNQSGLGGGTYNVTVTDDNGCVADTFFVLTEPDSIALTGTSTDLTCNPLDYPGVADGVGSDGSITIDPVTGGTGAYTYAWTPVSGGIVNGQGSQTGLSAGTYTLVVTDENLCSEEISFTLTEPDPIVIVGVETDLACNALSGDPDGEIDLTSVTGGTGAYSYLWTATSGGPIPSGQETTDSLYNLPLGDYNLVVTDESGCTQEADFSITGPTPVIVTDSTVVDLTCNALNGNPDGSIDITPAGGTPGYTYAWSTVDGSGLVATDQNQTELTVGTYVVVVTDSEGCSGTAQFDLTAPDPITLDSLAVDPLCHENSTPAQDGSITISNVQGGNGNYTYAWTTSGGGAILAGQEDDQSLTGLGGGQYVLTVSDDQGCTASATFNLDEPTEIVGTGTPVDLTCHEDNAPTDGSITINSVVGGTEAGSYDFAWTGPDSFTSTDQDISGLEAGDYQVVITDDNGCTDTLDFTLTQPETIAITSSTGDLDCNSSNGDPIGAITIVTTTGGDGTYTYEWAGPDSFTSTDEDLTALAAGVYYLTVTDGTGVGCEYLDTFELTEPDPIVFTLDPTDPSCHEDNTDQVDGSIAIIGLSGGTAPYTFNWSSAEVGVVAADQDQTNLGEGTYYVTVTDNAGCERLDTVDLTQPERIAVLAAIENLDCHAVNGAPDGTITLTVTGGTIAPASDYVYTWTASNGGDVTGQESSKDLTNLVAGTYSLRVEDDNSCYFEADYDVTQPDSISVVETLVDLTCNAGNAAGDGSVTLVVSGGTSPYTFAWTASNGGDVTGQETDQDISNLIAGTYTVVVTDANLCTTTETYTLGEPTPVTCTIPDLPANSCGDQIDCNGNTVTIAAVPDGGSGVYTYSIDGTNFGNDSTFVVGAGTHTITTRDSEGCESTCEITITEPDPLVAGTCVPEMDECQVGEGEIQVQAAGGCPPYTITWTSDPAANGLNEPSPQVINAADGNGDWIFLFTGAIGNTTYSFTVTDANGCVVGN